MTHQSRILLLGVAISVGAMFAPHRGHAGKARPGATKHTVPNWNLRSKKQLWKMNLKGVGQVGHSKYRNRINLRAGPGPGRGRVRLGVLRPLH